MNTVAITGVGVISALGIGDDAFMTGLLSGRSVFGYLSRPGREGPERWVGVEIDGAAVEAFYSDRFLPFRAASLSARMGLACVAQAVEHAGLDSRNVDPEKIGVIVGGTNFQMRSLVETWERYREKPEYTRPTHALTFWDSDLVGMLCECFTIHGEGRCVGGASAGGAVAVIEAARLVEMGIMDVCIAVGPMCDLSNYELQAFRSLGAMGSDRFAAEPESACRPFDRDSEGFIYGEGCAAIVMEKADLIGDAPFGVLARALGWGMCRSGSRNPHPQTAGQQRAMRLALDMAGVAASEIDYVNPHGTGSPLGDKTELESMRAVGLSQAMINATKSLTGHCLTASGAMEVVATVLQMARGVCHPTRNLDAPIDDGFRWVREEPVKADIRYAMSNSFAFGGLSTSIVLGPGETHGSAVAQVAR